MHKCHKRANRPPGKHNTRNPGTGIIPGGNQCPWYLEKEIAQKENINNPEKIAQQAINSFMHLAPYGKTSMLQDIENTRPTELEAFAGTIIKLGKQHNIKTPYNNLFMYLLKNA